MTIATYICNSKSNPESIRVHKYSDGTLHIEAISNSFAHEVGSSYDSLDEVEKYLALRDKTFGYTRKL